MASMYALCPAEGLIDRQDELERARQRVITLRETLLLKSSIQLGHTSNQVTLPEGVDDVHGMLQEFSWLLGVSEQG